MTEVTKTEAPELTCPARYMMTSADVCSQLLRVGWWDSGMVVSNIVISFQLCDSNESENIAMSPYSMNGVSVP